MRRADAVDVKAGPPAIGGRRVLLPLGLAAFITTLDGSVTSVAMPTIQRDLGLSLSSIEWVTATYLLAFGGLMLVGGRLTDMLGRRAILQGGLWLFGTASMVVALSSGVDQLLIGRSLQGVGAALVMPAAFALAGNDLAVKDRHLGVAVFTASIGAAIALGPIVGGSITQFLHWSYIFWLNVPVIVLTSFCVRAYVPRASRRVHGIGVRGWLSRLDVAGMAASAVALVGLTFALVEGGSRGFDSPPVLVAWLLAALGAVTTVLVEGRVSYPMLDRELVRHRLVAGCFTGQLLWGLGINGVVFYTSLFLQNELGLPPARAGLVFVPLAVSVAVSIPFVGRLTERWGAHRVVAGGMVLVAGGLTVVSTVGPGDSVLRVLPGVILIGIGSAGTTPMSSAPIEVVPVTRVGVVSALLSVSREVAGVLGVAVMGAVVASRQSVAARAGATPQEGFLSGYRWSLWLGASLALLGAVVALLTMYPGQARLRDRQAEAEEFAARALEEELNQQLAVDLVLELGLDLPAERVIDLRDGVIGRSVVDVPDDAGYR